MEFGFGVRQSRGKAEIAAEAVSRWAGLSDPQLISFRENLVFSAQASGRKVVVRVHRPGYQSEDAIRSELWFMAALAENGMSVPRPRQTPEGDAIAHLSDGLIASTLEWLDGDLLHCGPHVVDDQNQALPLVYARLGSLLARVHNCSEALQLPAWFVRPSWRLDGLLGEEPLWGRFWEHGDLSYGEAALAGEIREVLRDKLGAFEATCPSQPLIHADVLRENVMCSEGDVALIDFDDCGFGFPLYDLGIVVMQNLGQHGMGACTDSLLAGYDRFRTLTQSDLDMIVPFAAARALASIGWTHTRLERMDERNRQYIDRALRLAQRILDRDRIV